MYSLFAAATVAILLPGSVSTELSSAAFLRLVVAVVAAFRSGRVGSLIALGAAAARRRFIGTGSLGSVKDSFLFGFFGGDW